MTFEKGRDSDADDVPLVISINSLVFLRSGAVHRPLNEYILWVVDGTSGASYPVSSCRLPQYYDDIR